MAVTYGDNSIVLGGANDIYAGDLLVRTLVVMHTTTVATVVKDGSGIVILSVPSGAPTGAIVIPFGPAGVNFGGLEYDAGTGGMTAFLG